MPISRISVSVYRLPSGPMNTPPPRNSPPPNRPFSHDVSTSSMPGISPSLPIKPPRSLVPVPGIAIAISYNSASVYSPGFSCSIRAMRSSTDLLLISPKKSKIEFIAPLPNPASAAPPKSSPSPDNNPERALSVAPCTTPKPKLSGTSPAPSARLAPGASPAINPLVTTDRGSTLPVVTPCDMALLSPAVTPLPSAPVPSALVTGPDNSPPVMAPTAAPIIMPPTSALLSA